MPLKINGPQGFREKVYTEHRSGPGSRGEVDENFIIGQGDSNLK